ncbi:MAG: acyl-CoA synthetase FdrA, partial [Nitrospinota bacterium]|nr:acyl-CoA synthetase FdrA [Nitrospinota bacterium]
AEGAGGREARPSAWAAALDLSEGLPADGRLRGLFAGGTLAQEAHAILAALLPDLRTNFSGPLSDSDLGGHAVLDLGADEYTVRRPHPMMDPSSQGERIEAAAEAGGVSILLIDVVLGYGSHRDPAGVLAPAAERAIRRASSKGRGLAIVASVCGTAGDPQNREDQESRLRDAGVFVERDNARAAAIAGFAAVAAEGRPAGAAGPPADLPATARVINVGTDWFADALEDQGVPVVQVDWSPPAGGDKDLAAILQRLG